MAIQSIMPSASGIGPGSNSLLVDLCTYNDNSDLDKAGIIDRPYVCRICKKHVKANEYHIHDRPRYQPISSYNRQRILDGHSAVVAVVNVNKNEKKQQPRKHKPTTKLRPSTVIIEDNPLSGSCPCFVCDKEGSCNERRYSIECSKIIDWLL